MLDRGGGESAAPLFHAPFVVFLGDIQSAPYAKTAFGLAEWRAGDCLGQIRLAGCQVDVGVPDLDLTTALAAGARSLIIGSAAVGGGVPATWIPTLRAAAERGLDIVAGLHLRLASLEGLAEAAARGGARLVDLRVPPAGLPVGTGRKRSGRRLLTVGTDCACGKKYTALRLARNLATLGVAADFRATGQTGIMITGTGVPLDAVVADFLTGAAEALSPDAPPNHWDIVEGQGALFHPGYLQVTVGLLVGSQPDAFVVCHEESQGALAHGENHRQWCRDDECLVRAAGRGESEESLGESCSSSSNRLVRTRMLGGVGRAAREGRPYPILLRE